MKAAELRKKTKDELQVLLREKLLKREDLVLAVHQKKARNVKELHSVRKDIARIYTILGKTI